MKNYTVIFRFIVFISFFPLQCGAYDSPPDNHYITQLRAAAEAGDADSQFELGTLYQQGEGVAQNDTEAVKWFRKSAYQNDADAQSSLGFAYRGGFGVPQDYVVAYMWFDIAAKNGDEAALGLRSAVAELMTYEQISEARKLSRRWRPGQAVAGQ